MTIPQIDIEKTHQAILEMAAIIPSRKMFEAILRSMDVMMDDIVAAREVIVSEKAAVKNFLEKWDATFESFGTREAMYYQRITQADSDEDLKAFAYQPLLEGKYSDEDDPPDWPDVETPWRLMNSLSLIAALDGKKASYFKKLEERWMDNFARFWATCAILLNKAAKAPKALVETISLEGPGSGPDEDPSLYEQASAKARETMQSVSDFFSGKTVEEAKKSAKHVGIGLGIGLFIGVAVAALVFFKLRR